MPGSFYRSERKKQGGTNVKKQNKEGDAVGRKGKAFSVLQSISRSMSSLQKGCVNLFYSQVGRDKLSLQELNKGTLQSSKGAGLSSHSRDKSPSSQSYGFSSGHVWM